MNTAKSEHLRSFRWLQFDKVARLGRLALKELREILRDRRTIVTLFLMPLLLYPLLSIAMQQFFLSEHTLQARPEYRIGFTSDDDAEFVSAYLQLGDFQREVDQDRSNEPVLSFYQAEDIREAVHHLELDVGIRLNGDVPTLVDPTQDLGVQWEVFYCPESSLSSNAYAHLMEKVQRSNTAFLRARLRSIGVTQSPTPVETKVEEVKPVVGMGTGVSLITVVPLILILMTITGAVYPAIDLTAGERERGTLEILVAAPVSRISLLFAKYVAVLTVAMLTATVNLGTMTITILVSGLGPVLFGDKGLSVETVVQVFCLLLLFAAFFSSLLLALTSFARSFKEGQAYLIPLMLVSMAPGMMSIIPGLELGGVLTVAPLINIVLLARDLFQESADAVSATVVVLSTLLYAFAAIGLAARVFGSEDVLYGDHGGWSAFWHRPVESRPVPTVSSAMTCLALMFPGYFLVNSAIHLLSTQPLSVRLMLASAVTVLLFVGVPYLFAGLGKVEFRGAFNWRPAPLLAFIAAIVLGLSLWPIAHEIVVYKSEFGLVDLSHMHEDRVQQLLDEIRKLPLAVILLCMAVVPAVCEEFFFRGYLFSALHSQAGPRTSIFGSALLFGLFHLIVTDRLAFERFIPSMMMGVVLGWVCWRTVSVLPGMLLHTVYNGILISISYYKDQLQQWGIGVEEQLHLPITWVLGGAVAVGIAILVIEKTTPSNAPE